MSDHETEPTVPPLVKLSIEIERPKPGELRNLDRAKKYTLLKENSARRMDAIIAWLREKNLWSQVHSIGEATVFNQIYMETTEKVARELERAPGVRRVSQIDSFGAARLSRSV